MCVSACVREGPSFFSHNVGLRDAVQITKVIRCLNLPSHPTSPTVVLLHNYVLQTPQVWPVINVRIPGLDSSPHGSPNKPRVLLGLKPRGKVTSSWSQTDWQGWINPVWTNYIITWETRLCLPVSKRQWTQPAKCPILALHLNRQWQDHLPKSNLEFLNLCGDPALRTRL